MICVSVFLFASLTPEQPHHVDWDTVPDVDRIANTPQFVVRLVNRTKNRSNEQIKKKPKNFVILVVILQHEHEFWHECINVKLISFVVRSNLLPDPCSFPQKR